MMNCDKFVEIRPDTIKKVRKSRILKYWKSLVIWEHKVFETTSR